MNTELLEALNILEKEKDISKETSAGCNRKFTAECLQESFWKG